MVKVLDTWAELKTLIDDMEDPVLNFDSVDGRHYDIWFQDGLMLYRGKVTIEADPAPVGSDQEDWENNYQPSKRQSVESSENPKSIAVGFSKKKDKTVNGNKVTCPSGSTTTLCTRTVKAGQNVLIERIIISKDSNVLATITVKDVTNSNTERRYWMDQVCNSMPDRIFIKNEGGSIDVDISLTLKHSSGSDITATGVMVITRTKK